jgi:hypothetical protein
MTDAPFDIKGGGRGCNIPHTDKNDAATAMHANTSQPNVSSDAATTFSLAMLICALLTLAQSPQIC